MYSRSFSSGGAPAEVPEGYAGNAFAAEPPPPPPEEAPPPEAEQAGELPPGLSALLSPLSHVFPFTHIHFGDLVSSDLLLVVFALLLVTGKDDTCEEKDDDLWLLLLILFFMK